MCVALPCLRCLIECLTRPTVCVYDTLRLQTVTAKGVVGAAICSFVFYFAAFMVCALLAHARSLRRPLQDNRSSGRCRSTTAWLRTFHMTEQHSSMEHAQRVPMGYRILLHEIQRGRTGVLARRMGPTP